MTPSRLLLLLALIVFALATFSVTISHVLLVPLGLALFVASFLV